MMADVLKMLAPQCVRSARAQQAIARSGHVDAANSLSISAVGFQIFQRGPSSIRDFFVLNGLALFQSSQAGLLDGQDVNENVSPPAFRLDESVSFFQTEPLHRAARHFMVSRGSPIRIILRLAEIHE
jgi:hypothetical protein